MDKWFGELLNDNARRIITEFLCGSPLVERRRMKYQLLRIALVGPTMVWVEQPNCFRRVDNDEKKVLARTSYFCDGFNKFCVSKPIHIAAAAILFMHKIYGSFHPGMWKATQWL